MRRELSEIHNLIINKRDFKTAWRSLKQHPFYLSYISLNRKPNPILAPLLENLSSPSQNSEEENYRKKMVDMINATQDKRSQDKTFSIKEFKPTFQQLVQLTSQNLLDLAKTIKDSPQQIRKCHRILIDNLQNIRLDLFNEVLEIAKFQSHLKNSLTNAILKRINELSPKILKYFFKKLYRTFGEERQTLNIFHDKHLKKGWITLSEYLNNLYEVKQLSSSQIDIVQRIIEKNQIENCIHSVLRLSAKNSFFFPEATKKKILQHFGSQKTSVTIKTIFLLQNCIGDHPIQFQRVSRQQPSKKQQFSLFKTLLLNFDLKKAHSDSLPYILTIIWNLIDSHIKDHRNMIRKDLILFERKNHDFLKQKGISQKKYEKKTDLNIKSLFFPIIQQKDTLLNKKVLSFEENNLKEQQLQLKTNHNEHIPLSTQYLKKCLQKEELLIELQKQNSEYTQIMKTVIANQGYQNDPDIAKKICSFIEKNIRQFDLNCVIMVKKVYRKIKIFLPANFYKAILAHLSTLISTANGRAAYGLVAEFGAITFDQYTNYVLQQKINSNIYLFNAEQIFKILKEFENIKVLSFQLIRGGTQIILSQLKQQRNCPFPLNINSIQYVAKFSLCRSQIIESIRSFLCRSKEKNVNQKLVKVLLDLCEQQGYLQRLVVKQISENLGEQRYSRIYKFLVGQQSSISQQQMFILSIDYLTLCQNNIDVLNLAKKMNGVWPAISMVPFIQNPNKGNLEIQQENNLKSDSLREQVSKLLFQYNFNQQEHLHIVNNHPMPTKTQFLKLIKLLPKMSSKTSNMIEIIVSNLFTNDSQFICLLLEQDSVWSQKFIDRVLRTPLN